MAKRVMKLAYGNVDGETKFEKLSYEGITANNADYVGYYILKTASGKYAATDKLDAAMIAIKVINANGTITNELAEKFGLETTESQDGTRKLDVTDLVKTGTANEVDNDILNKIINYFEENYGQFSLADEMGNADYFQDALRNGALFLYKNEQTSVIDDETGNTVNVSTGYKSIAWSSCGSIADTLNTEDDAKAQAEYKSQSLVLSNQDKLLDLELKQIETQHKATETEYDSVKEVIYKNIET